MALITAATLSAPDPFSDLKLPPIPPDTFQIEKVVPIVGDQKIEKPLSVGSKPTSIPYEENLSQIT